MSDKMKDRHTAELKALHARHEAELKEQHDRHAAEVAGSSEEPVAGAEANPNAQGGDVSAANVFYPPKG